MSRFNQYHTTLRAHESVRIAADERYNRAMDEIRRELEDPRTPDIAKARLLAKLKNLENEMRNGKVTPTPKVQEAPKRGEAKA